MKPSIGRIVHFVLKNDEHRPPVIVKVWSDTCVNLQVFFDGTNDSTEADITGTSWRTSITFKAEGDAAHTWHWPERLE